MRYVILPANTPRCDLDNPPPAPPLPHPTAFVSEPIKTGLFDADGNAIYRLPDVIGFLSGEDKR